MSRKPKVFVPQAYPQCCGKNSYPNEQVALDVAGDQMILKYGLQLTTYRCTCGCGGWHLTRVKPESSEHN